MKKTVGTAFEMIIEQEDVIIRRVTGTFKPGRPPELQVRQLGKHYAPCRVIYRSDSWNGTQDFE